MHTQMPFNPETKIRFDIASFTNVSLTIYDVTGKEVTLLINEQLKPGSYKAMWNAANYSSGIYFYKIETGAFAETKKIILLK